MGNQLFVAAAQSVGSLGLSQSSLYILWIGIVIYLLFMLGIGMWSSSKVKGMNDFLVAGRRLPLWMATTALLATWFGAGSSMGVAATVFSDGIGAVRADPFGASFSLIIAGIFIVGMLRRLKCLTVTDIIERRYGKWAGIYASAWMVPVYVGWLGAQLLGMGTILHVLTGMDMIWGTLIGAAVVLIYTYAGGMWAVTLTDVVQVTIIIIGLFIIVPGAVTEAGGWAYMMKNIPEADFSLWIPPAADAVKGHSVDDWAYYIGGWIIMGLGCTIGQDLVQRSLASRNEKIAVSSAVMSGFFYMAVALVPITIGFAARFVFAKHGITAEVLGSDLENQVLPRMAIMILGSIHPVILTIFLAALISAIMSSADSSLLAASSLICNNIVGSIWPRKSDKSLLRMTRMVTILLTVVALFLAIKVESIYALMINSWASQLVIVLIPVVTALYVPNASKNCAWAAMATSTVVWLAYAFISGIAGTNMGFVELMNSSEMDRALTCGAVYGFAAGIIAFICCYLGERVPHWVLDQPDEEDE